MKINHIITCAGLALLSACALNAPDTQAEYTGFPLRLQIDEEGADLPDAEDYGIEISFADYLGDLPANAIVLTYSLEGSGDFANVAIDEILYEYEDDDCVWEREISFTANTITIPVDPDMGTVPEAFEIVVAFNLAGDEAADGGFELVITGIESADGVLFSAANTFEYEILDNDLAGEWVTEITDEATFAAFQEVFAGLLPDLAEVALADLTGEIKLEFAFEEMVLAIELNEEEEVTECENGETETEMEHLVIELEADYDAEDGELELEGSHFTDEGEELDFIIEASYEILNDDEVRITFTRVINEDQYEEGDELYAGEFSIIVERD